MAPTASITAAPMTPSAAFGVTGSLQDGLQFLEDLTFISVASHLIVEKNLSDSKASARFITGTPTMCGISAIAVSPDRHNFAVAETGSPSPMSSPVISVYAAAKLIKRRSLTSPLAGSDQYVSLCFTCDGKHIAALGGSPEWQLQLWNIMGIKIVGSIKTVTLNSTGAYQVRCCPLDENWLTVCGDGFAKTYKRVDNDLRQVSTNYSNQEGHKVLCHTWITLPPEVAENDEEDKEKSGEQKNSKVVKKLDKEKKKSVKELLVVNCACVYALDSGELLYVNKGELIAKIPMQNSRGEKCVAHTIIPYSKGIICGENGTISIYEHDTHYRTHETYKRVRSFKVEETNAQVCSLTLSIADVLMCLLFNNRIIHFSFEDIDEMSSDIVASNDYTQSYHQPLITGMDTCVLKPFVVTCSTDNSVRVWNYEELSCEILKTFPSEALSVSIHPNGLYILVGFLDCLMLFVMLINDLRLWKEFPLVKGCTNCAFCHGGQYFAAVSGNSIHIISTYTGHTTGHLQAHLNKVQSIWWAHDDFSIVTAGTDGAIYEWDLKTCKRSREHVIKGSMQMCAIGVKKSKLFLSTTSDCKLRELDAVEVFQTIESDVNLTQIVQFVDGNLVFVGTEHGAIRSYQYPFTGVFHEVKVFVTSVVKVCISNDNRLFCASEDGLIVMFDIHTPGSQRATWTNIMTWSQEVLISKADLEDYKERVMELETKIADTQKHCEYEIKYNNKQLAGKIMDLEKYYEGLLDEAIAKQQTLYMAKAEMELNVERKQNELQTIHTKLLKDMEEAYCKKIIIEISRYDEVMRKKEVENARWTQEMDTMKQAHELALQELMKAYEAKLEDTQEELQKTKENKEQITLDFAEVQRVVAEDVQNEIDEQRVEYEAKLVKADEAIWKIMGENGILKSKYMKFQKEVDLSYTELNELLSQKKELYAIVNGCQHDIQMLQKDLEERDEVLLERDCHIYELKRANQELEKFKWVLDWKIKDLIHSIGPSQIEAAEVKGRMEAMEDELLSAHDKLKDKDLLVTSLKAKLHAASAERKRVLFEKSRQAKLLKDFQADFHELSQKIESIRGLKMGIMELYQKHVEGKFKLQKLNRPMHEEFIHQRELLERKVKILEHELRNERKKGFRTHMNMIKDNQHLLFQTRELREEVRSRVQTPMSSAPGSQRGSRPTTSDGGKELSLMRKQLAELQLELSARNARVELLEEQIAASDGGLKQCMGVKKKPLSCR